MMKKPLIIFTGLLVLVLSGFLGCQKYPLPADLPLTPTPTPWIVPVDPPVVTPTPPFR